MAGTKLGELFVKIGADLGDFQKSMKQIGTESRQLANKLGGLSIAAAAAATGAAAAIVKSNLTSIDALAKTSDQLGITTEALQGLRHAAELTGVSSSTLDGAIQKLTKNVSEAATGTGTAKDALLELGLSAQQLNKLSPDQQMYKIANAMENVTEQGDRVRLSMELFGRSGGGLVNTLAGGEKALKGMVNEVDELGAAITRVDAAKIEAANDAFTRAGVATGAFGKQLTVAVSPVLTAITNEFIDSAKAAGGFGQIATDIMDKVYKAAGHVGNALQTFKIIFKSLELAANASFAVMLTMYSEVQKFAARFGNSAIASINMVIDKVNMLGADIQKLDQFEVGGGFLEGMAESFKERSKEIAAEIQDLALGELPSDKIEKYIASAVAAEEKKFLALQEVKAKNDEKRKTDDEAETARLASVAQMRLEAAEKYADYEGMIEQRKVDQKRQAMDTVISFMNGGSRKLFELGKAAAISDAIVNAYKGISKTWNEYPYPYNIPMAAAHGVAAFQQVQNIKSAQFGGSGGSGAIGFNSGGQEVVRTETQVASINIMGGQNAVFSGDQIRSLIGAINDAVGDGVQLRTN